MAAGSAGLAHRVGRAQLATGGLAAVVLQGLGICGAALSPVLWVALIGFVFGGVAHGVKNVLLRTLIHERVPDALRGRAFAAYNGARNGAELGALVLGGIAVGALGARASLLLAGVGPAAIGTASLLLLLSRRHGAGAITTTTNEGRVLHARVQG
jgi:predicted MFS family arabinose efflux permease